MLFVLISTIYFRLGIAKSKRWKLVNLLHKIPSLSRREFKVMVADNSDQKIEFKRLIGEDFSATVEFSIY